MADFQYFVPGKQRLTLKQCRDGGLGYAFDSNPHPLEVAAGPDGQRGVVLCRTDKRIGFYGDQQNWRKIPKNPIDAWCGIWNDDHPTPEDLKRPNQLGGKWLTFEDGSSWLVPFARRFYQVEDDMFPVCELPRMLDVDDGGRDIPGEVKHAYRRLWEMAMLYDDAYRTAAENAPKGAGIVRMDFEQAGQAVEAALRVNYRVGLIELILLGVYEEKMRTDVLNALVDMDTVSDFYKKNWRGYSRWRTLLPIPLLGQANRSRKTKPLLPNLRRREGVDVGAAPGQPMTVGPLVTPHRGA